MRTYEDKSGKVLPAEKVEEIALGNIMASMSLKKLALAYLSEQTRAEILQWATNEDGNFPQTKS